MRKHLSPAMVISLIALFFALTGGAIAAQRFIITSTKQIKPSVLTELRGKTGPKVAAGTPGTPGSQGPAGKDGRDGATGAAGAAGATGATGQQGPAGKDGATGQQGPAGKDGATGATGATGQQGPAGKDGATGQQGPAGPQGPAGASMSDSFQPTTTNLPNNSWVSVGSKTVTTTDGENSLVLNGYISAYNQSTSGISLVECRYEVDGQPFPAGNGTNYSLVDLPISAPMGTVPLAARFPVHPGMHTVETDCQAVSNTQTQVNGGMTAIVATG